MRISVFSEDSNPRIDPPLCHKSKSYVESLLNTGRARQIAEGVQLLDKIPDARNFAAGMEDWRRIQFSKLCPEDVKRLGFKYLRISTQQLITES